MLLGNVLFNNIVIPVLKNEAGLLNLLPLLAKDSEYTDLTAFIKHPELIKKIENLTSREILELSIIPEDQVTFLPPVRTPEKILCIGLNYRSHSDECNMELPSYPVVFGKFNNSLAAHLSPIPVPLCSTKIDYEAELVIIISKVTNRVSPEEALNHVFGYTIGNDLSARDFQFRTGQWLLGKSCDSFAPLGPFVALSSTLFPNELNPNKLNPNELDIECRVNGVLRQSANTREMIFSCGHIVSYLSQFMTLQPGDLIFTGTPSGVILGLPEPEQVWLTAGDEIEITIHGIGTLKNKLI